MKRINVGHILAPVGLVFFAASGSGLVAQGTASWLPVDLGHVATADVRVKVLSTASGYQVFFKNAGTTPVHFGFYLDGIQTSDATSSNGRVHLRPQNLTGPLTIQPSPGAQGPIQVRAVEAVVGEADAPTSNAFKGTSL